MHLPYCSKISRCPIFVLHYFGSVCCNVLLGDNISWQVYSFLQEKGLIIPKNASKTEQFEKHCGSTNPFNNLHVDAMDTQTPKPTKEKNAADSRNISDPLLGKPCMFSITSGSVFVVISVLSFISGPHISTSVERINLIKFNNFILFQCTWLWKRVKEDHALHYMSCVKSCNGQCLQWNLRKYNQGTKISY